jgi:hypothetical protein
MDPLYATIEEFAAEGFHAYRVPLSTMSCDSVEVDQLASTHLPGPDHRAAFSTTPLCGVRWSTALGEAVAIRRCTGQAR